MRAFFTIIIFLAVVVAAGAVSIWFGFYDISARVPHWEATSEIIEAVRDRSIIVHSSDISTPPLGDPAKGALLYNEACLRCHGAPGIHADPFTRGLYPEPANLLKGFVQQEWSRTQLYWIVENGIKFTAMPAFGPTMKKEEIASVVAFLQRLPKLSPGEYKKMTGAVQSQQ